VRCFGMNFLEQDKYTVIDLETTGNRIKGGDQIFQIGICLIENGEVTERYSSLIKPTIAIPPFIENLTGITNADVAHAPSIEEVLPELLKRLDQTCLVAHNIHFDLSFLQHTLQENGYNPFRGTVIDTVELSRMLFPDRGGYKLNQLAVDLDVEHDHPHQADSDAFATAQLFLNLCEKLSSLPLVTIQRMIPLARTLHSDIEILLRRVEVGKQLQVNTDVYHSNQFELYRHLAFKVPEMENKNDSSNNLKQADLLFHDMDIEIDKVLRSVIPDFEKREGQQQFFHAVTEAFETSQHGLFEVGTGTGKTLAYLLASLYWAKLNDEKVVVSTHTIQLQEQIREKELPLLEKALPFSFQSALLKGRNHYLCLRKFEQSLLGQEERNYDHDLTKMQFLVWLTETETGDIEELNLSSGGREYWNKVQSESSSCVQKNCPWFERCFYFKAKRKAQQADLVITNHSLLLQDLQYEHVLPRYQYLVVDEAHHLDRVATDQFGNSIKFSMIHFLLQRLIAIDKPNLGQQVINELQFLTEGEALQKRMDELTFLLHELKVVIEELFTIITEYAEEKQKGITDGNIKSVRIVHQKETGDKWLSLLQCADDVASKTERLFRTHAYFLREIDEADQELTYGQRGIVSDWNGALQRIKEYMNIVGNIFSEASPNEYVYWVEYEPRGTRHTTALFQMPLQVRNPLAEQLLDKKNSVVFTSATLQINESYSYYTEQLGLTPGRLKVETISSPFDYEQQSALLISQDISRLSEVSDQVFARELASAILEMAKVSQGRMLVLFTSYHMLRSTHQYLKDQLQELGIFLFAQGVDSGSRGKLTKNFQSQEKAILLGTNSFWEGIDIPGEDLSCLVIVKLPFTPPNTPFYEAKAEQLKAENKNPFMEYALPQAVIRFKQGFGRLIRKSTDKGVVVVFDRRIIESRYGQAFLRSLPAIQIQAVDKEQLVKEIQQRLG
jgi:ATP-dependent DNA helicase DinG